MKLTKSHVKVLELYKKWQESPPTLWQLIAQNIFRYLLLFLLVVLLNIVAPAGGLDPLRWIAIGLFVGVLLRDIGLFLRSIRLWPLTSAILNWQRIDELLNEPDK